MKKIALVTAILLMMVLNTQSSASPFKDQLEEIYAKGKFLVLKADDIPSVGVNKIETLGLNNYVHLKINPDGTWKEKKLLGISKTTSRLKKGTILKIRKNRLKKGSFGIFTQTQKTILVEDRDYDRDSALVHYNVFTFKFGGSKDLEFIKKTIGQFFKVYDTLKEAEEGDKIEIDIGMTIEEVIDLLGKPKKRANLGNKTKLKYDDMTITFIDGKVTDVDF